MCKNKDELGKLVAKRRKLKALAKKLETRLDEIDTEIIEYANAKGAKGGKDGNSRVVFGEDYKVSVCIITQHPFDADKLKAYFGDDVINYQKTNTYPRISIS